MRTTGEHHHPMTTAMNDDKATKFEEDLKAYFPHIWDLNQLGKADANLWEVVTVMLEMRSQDVTGRVSITYSKGHIDTIRKDIDVLAFKGKRPGY